MGMSTTDADEGYWKCQRTVVNGVSGKVLLGHLLVVPRLL